MSTTTSRTFQWTHEVVARYWDYIGAKKEADAFANIMGDCVVNLLSLVEPVKGQKVLDYGCGRGFLIPHLLKAGAKVSGCDLSPEAVAYVDRKFAVTRNFDRATTDTRVWREGTFDAVCLLEVIEHVLDEDLDTVLNDVYRLLSPDGAVIISTPNDEDLSKETLCCPNCATEFHRWQHVRSWTAESLRAKLEDAGFAVPFCGGVELLQFRPAWLARRVLLPRGESRLWAAKTLAYTALRLRWPRLQAMAAHTGPNLIAIATR